MRMTAIIMLVLAVALGAISVYLAQGWLEQQQTQQAATTATAPAGPSIELTTIVVAKRPMNFGDTVTEEYLTEVKWPAKTLPPGSFKTIKELVGTGEKKRVVLRAIQTNEPILDSRMSGAGGKATLATILEQEMRAVTIRVNDVNGVAGFVLPGDRVDVLLTRDENAGGGRKGGGGGNSMITDILLQNVKVLGIDQKANDDENKPKVARAVTLEVVPMDAQRLALATTVGTLSLALRNEANANPETTRTVRISDLKSQTVGVPVKQVVAKPSEGKAPKRAVRVAPAAPKVPDWAKITIVRGIKLSTEKVQRDKSGNVIPKGSKTTGAKDVDEESGDNGSKKLGPTTLDGPKLLVPQG